MFLYLAVHLNKAQITGAVSTGPKFYDQLNMQYHYH